jgi:hypothetical protein
MNIPVNFELAKLLKEKGFDKKVRMHYESNGNRFFDNIPCNFNNVELICSAPTIAEVVMWLYEKHGIWVSVLPTEDITMFSYKIKSKFGLLNNSQNFNSPTEAYEAAIEYCLTKLI